MIGSVSQFARAYLQGPIAPVTVTELYNGTGTDRLPLRQRPVISVAALTINTTSIPMRPAIGQPGYIWDTSILYLTPGYYNGLGYGWSTFGGNYGNVQNVQVTYTAGYQTTQTQAVQSIVNPSATNPAINTTDLLGTWNSDQGVAYASTGTAFTLVTTAPSLAGTYQLSVDDQGNTQYLFAAADVGANVTITYGYTPEDIVQALVELVGEREKTRNRIGMTSVHIQGQSTSYSQRDMNAAIKSMLQPYRQLAPVQ